MRRQYVKRKIFCLFLTAVLLLSLMPVTKVRAEGNYYFGFGVKTKDVYLAGTDDDVYAGFRFRDGTEIRKLLDLDGNDHERNQYREYFFTDSVKDPWMISDFFLEKDGNNDWYCDYVYIYYPNLFSYSNPCTGYPFKVYYYIDHDFGNEKNTFLYQQKEKLRASQHMTTGAELSM
ncbi:MAG TPA: hypothetical protein GXX36_06415 [Clostridiaceae bacterium]|nr:hypothetical protein [Clostridiaceae bacterium]